MKRCHQLCLISVNLVSHLAKNITDRNGDWTLFNVTFVRGTLRNYIGNCSTANVLCKQSRAEKGKIMERFKELLEKRWRNPREDSRLMDKLAEKLRWFFKRRDWQDTWCVACFICFSYKCNCEWYFRFYYEWINSNGVQLRHIILI